MELNQSTVHRGLDVRMKVGGFEALDLISSLILAGILNLFQLPGVFALGVPAIALLVLYFGKRNKPDGFLLHLIRYYSTPGHYSAGAVSENFEHLQGKVYDK